VTEHDKGALVADATGRHRVDAVAVPRVLDTTGAGDAFASGFLGGLALGRPVDEAGRMGADCAARVLGHYGARDGAAARAISIPAA
jgi:fructokinase